MLRIIELQNLDRKDIPLSYRRTFTANARAEGANSGSFTQSIEFDIEKTAMGTTEISVRIVGSCQYPLVPLKRELRTHISQLESGGALP